RTRPGASASRDRKSGGGRIFHWDSGAERIGPRRSCRGPTALLTPSAIFGARLAFRQPGLRELLELARQLDAGRADPRERVRDELDPHAIVDVEPLGVVIQLL